MLKMNNLNRSLLGFFLLLVLGTIWGTGYSIARLAMTNGVHPLGYSLWQSLGPAILLGLLTLTRRQRPAQQVNPKTSNPTLILYYFIAGLTGIVIPNTAMYFAALHLPAGILAMVVNIVPILAYPLAVFTRTERFNWQRLFGVLLACCGIMLIIMPQSSLPSRAMIPWVFLTLIAPLSFAVCSIFVAQFQPNNSNAITLSTGMLFASSLMLIPIVLWTHHVYFFQFPFTMTDQILLLEILLSSIGYVLFFQLIKIAGPVYYSLVDTIVVLTGLFWSYIIFGEKLNEWTATAVIFILFALLLVTRQQQTVHKSQQVRNSQLTGA